ncbi:hypothetical protein [Acetobacter fallax]|uniref:Outer membrane protein n=1 Tax=Acetobacter fallax TaxID=1737473 RepID=A0ABX0KBF5_9PROT|nr:hypothetical protein [Acetobacter fallax]NHO32188.1 hypothetical protein [Acetobacter fallax]NHO35759.1 hypothetical protein [Acetobacter fallax]
MKYTSLLSVLGLMTFIQGASADDSAPIQTMLDACYAGQQTCDIDFQGAHKVLGTSLKIDPELVTIRNVTFECQMTSGTCLYVSEEGYGHRDNTSITRLERVTLFGNKSIDGITMNYAVPNDYVTNAAMPLFNVSIQGFNHGITLGSGVWGADMVNVLIGNGNTGIYVPPGTQDAGERSSFVGGTIYNNAIAGIDEESSAEIDFEGTSFDFNEQQMLLNGPTSFTGHIENRQTGKPEIVLNALVGVPAGSIYMSAGSTITVDGWDASSPQQPCYVDTKLAWNRVLVPATLYGFGGTQGAVCGPGKVATWDGQAPQFQ